jgi:hypothetical protein
VLADGRIGNVFSVNVGNFALIAFRVVICVSVLANRVGQVLAIAEILAAFVAGRVIISIHVIATVVEAL